MSNSHRNMPNPNQSPEIYHYNTLNAHRVLLRKTRSASCYDASESKENHSRQWTKPHILG